MDQVCYWDEVSGEMKNRDCTPEEQADIDARREAGEQLSPSVRHITKRAFRSRFTTAEKVDIDLASIDDPAATPEARRQSASIRVCLADAAAATFIDLDAPDTRDGVLMLEAASMLAEGRALEILDAEIQPDERPE